MRRRTGSALVETMACRLFVAKPFPWINADLLLIRPFGTNFVEKRIEIWNFSFTKIHLKMSSAEWQSFRPGKDESIRYRHSQGIDYITTARHSSIMLCAYRMGWHGIWIPTVDIRQPNKCLIWIPEILTITIKSYWIKFSIFHAYLNTHTHTHKLHNGYCMWLTLFLNGHMGLITYLANTMATHDTATRDTFYQLSG